MNIGEFVNSINNDIAEAYARDNDCLKDSDKMLQMFESILNNEEYRNFLIKDLQRICNNIKARLAEANFDYTNYDALDLRMAFDRHYSVLQHIIDRSKETQPIVLDFLLQYNFNIGTWKYDDWRLGNPDPPKATFSYTPPTNQDSQESNNL